MQVDKNHTGHVLAFTPWIAGAPVRTGWYVASTERNNERRAYFDTITGTWSAMVEADASAGAHEAARVMPMDPSRARAIEWRGLTQRSAAWLAAEMA